MLQEIGRCPNCMAPGTILAISKDGVLKERRMKLKDVHLGRTRGEGEKMAASPTTRKITLDPYILVLFVEKVLAEPERTDGGADEDESSTKEGWEGPPSMN